MNSVAYDYSGTARTYVPWVEVPSVVRTGRIREAEQNPDMVVVEFEGGEFQSSGYSAFVEIDAWDDEIIVAERVVASIADGLLKKKAGEFVSSLFEEVSDNGDMEISDWVYSTLPDETFQIEWQRNGIILGFIVDKVENESSYYLIVNGKNKGWGYVPELLSRGMVKHLVGLAGVLSRAN